MQEVSQEEIEKLLKHISVNDYFLLVEDFLLETSEQLESISEKKFNSEPENVIRLVHTIKGSSSSLGFDHLSHYSAKFEELLKNVTIEKKSNIFTTYRDSVRQSLTTIKHFFNGTDRSRI